MRSQDCLLRATGTVIRGFGRGSKELGIPTGFSLYFFYYILANLSDNVIEALPNSMHSGVYAGFAQIENGPVIKMVMSLGWNPFYKNIKRSMVLHHYFFVLT